MEDLKKYLLDSFDLQLFGPEDEGRTEDPTEKKKREEREKGKVAKSVDLVSGFVLFFAIVVIYFAWGANGAFINTFQGLFTSSVETAFQYAKGDLTLEIITGVFQDHIATVIRLMAPLLTTVFVIAFLTNAFQVGFIFSLKPLKPDFSRIKFSFPQMAKRILFSKQVLANLVKAVLKSSVIITVAIVIIRGRSREISDMIFMEPATASVHISKIGFLIIVVSALFLILLSIPDYLFERKQHQDSMKMTKHEFMEEMRQTEGDPQLRQRLRERQRELASRRMMQEVPNADVVITNPTHYAVALRFDRASMSAPSVVAKGMNMIARRIKEIAQENEVYVYENKPLARELYRLVDVGDEIPAELFEAVARVLAFVYKQREAYAGV